MALPQTEARSDGDTPIDRLDGHAALTRMIDVQIASLHHACATLCRPSMPRPTLVADTLRGSRAADLQRRRQSSGLMALADGAELPGTFGIAPERIAHPHGRRHPDRRATCPATPRI